MNEMLMSLTIAYVVLAALLLLSLIYSQLHWYVKALLLLLAIPLYTVSYMGWKQAQGWPGNNPLPEKFLLHFAVIEEPDKNAGKKGNIFIWLSNLNQQLAAEPRAYRMAYERKIHTRLEDALQEMKSGKLQLGLTKPDDTAEKSINTIRLSSKKSVDIEFVDLPDPALPEK